MIRFLAVFLILLAARAGAAPAPPTVERPDGTRVTFYVDAPARAAYPIAAILQGSECLRVSDKYAPMIERLTRAGVGVLRVEKPGLGPDVPIGACPPEYLRLNTVDRRVLDLLAVVGHLRRQPAGWNGRLCLSSRRRAASSSSPAAAACRSPTR